MIAALLALAGCDAVEPVPPVEPPTLAWLSPHDGDRVAAGEVPASLLVEGFSFEDLSKHNEGAPIGVAVVDVDGAEVLRVGTTTFRLPVAAGAHTLTATLTWADDEPVTVAEGELCAEDDPRVCEPVAASIAVTAE